MSASPVHDHRRESATKPKEMKPLLTREPLSRDREKKPPAQPLKKRKRVTPTTPAFTFDPKCNHIPSGKQDPAVSPPVLPRLSASAPSTSSYDEQQTTPFADREIHSPFYEGYRIFSEHSSTDHPTSYPDSYVNDMSSVPPDSYDSPASHTSSSSPAPSDQSPCAAEFSVPTVEYRQPQPSVTMCPYDTSVYIPQVIHQASYGYPMDSGPDRPVQSYPVQYFDTAYGRSGLHGGPAYPGNNGFYPPSRRY